MRRIARNQQRKRQTWLALPASGIEELGHGQISTGTISQSSAEAPGGRREGIAAQGQAGYRAGYGAYRLRGQAPIISEVLQIAIMKMDLMADNELIEFLRYPRHEIVISKNVAREFHKQSLVKLKRDPCDKFFAPCENT